MAGHPALCPLTARSLVLPNRVMTAMRPPQQWVSTDGCSTDLSGLRCSDDGFARVGLVMLEAVVGHRRGRSDTLDLLVDSDMRVPLLARLVQILHSAGTAAGLRLTPSSARPHRSRARESGPRGEVLAVRSSRSAGVRPANEPGFTADSRMADEFRAAADRAFSAGFDIIELDGSPFLSARPAREGDVGCPLREVAIAVREAMPSYMPFMLRLPALGNRPNSRRTNAEVLGLARSACNLGIDLIAVDCAHANILTRHSNRAAAAKTAARFRKEAGVMTAVPSHTVTRLEYADFLITTGAADLVEVHPNPQIGPSRPALHSNMHGRETAVGSWERAGIG